MKTFNRSTIIGFLGETPKLIETEKTKLVPFSVATKEPGAKGKTETEWHNVVVYGKSAEYVSQHFKKGAFALIEGRSITRKWEDEDGNKRSKKVIIASRVLHMERKVSDSDQEAMTSDGYNLNDVPF